MRQINYALGDNPRKSSYVVGFGANPPQNPHHRTAHGSWLDSMTGPTETRHVLYGALVGGPAAANDAYTDLRSDYVTNEVATDYNAGFTCALARLTQEYGGTPLAGFPVAEQPDATRSSSRPCSRRRGGTFTEVKAMVRNQSAFPARALTTARSGTGSPSTPVSRGRASPPTTASAARADARPKQAAGQPLLRRARAAPAEHHPGGQSQHRREVQFGSASARAARGTRPTTRPTRPTTALAKPRRHALRRRQADLGHRARHGPHRHHRAERARHPRGVRRHLDRRSTLSWTAVDRRGQRGRRVRRLPGARQHGACSLARRPAPGRGDGADPQGNEFYVRRAGRRRTAPDAVERGVGDPVGRTNPGAR